jgi:integrase/recombinase XerD
MLNTRRWKESKIATEWFANTGLASRARDYLRYLTVRGYSARTICGYFNSVAHFVHWLGRGTLEVADLNEGVFERFLNEHLARCRCAQRCCRSRADVRAGLRCFLEMLRANGQCRPEMPSGVAVSVRVALEEFNHYLVEVRGLSSSTRMVRLRHIRDFLTDGFGSHPIALSTLKPVDVLRFFSHYTDGWAPVSIKALGSALRSYFQFRASKGEQTTSLIAAIPRVAHWRLAGLPQMLSTAEIKQLLGAFDRDSATGKRDYAITRCLLDLGLRRTEVAHLCLEDVDWHEGTLQIHAKGKRIDVLPLPAHTGRAIAEYLQHGRPQTTRRELFVRHRPPVNGSAGLDIVRNAVRNAAERCGLGHRIRGTHILRHTLAGRLVQRGARFKEIADLLRHRSLDTTTIYAKVDLEALARVALPWPGRRV